jgi:DNA-directed RNA polymerase subunit F
MIKDKKPITLAEARELLKQSDSEKAKALSDFMKKFVKITAADSEKYRKGLDELNIAKLREEDIVKLIDILPEDAEDIRKIFSGTEVNLDQNEISKVLEILKHKK